MRYAVFIPSHGRAERVVTIQALREHGYTGQIYVICDTEDEQLKEYQDKFKSDCITFDKHDYDGKFDIGDNFSDRRVVVYARNALFDIAQDLGYKRFIVLDDDYKSFQFRYSEGEKLAAKAVTDLDAVFTAFFNFLDVSGACALCMAQGGDYIGGVLNQNFQAKLTRKAMNGWFLRTDRRFEFVGRINEDTTTNALLNQTGKLFLTCMDVMLDQITTQQNAGGLSDIYLDWGTFYKSFYSVMFAPSCVSVGVMNTANARIHHMVDWTRCAPKILNERYKK